MLIIHSCKYILHQRKNIVLVLTIKHDNFTNYVSISEHSLNKAKRVSSFKLP
jgi:hypothetical protein